MPECITDGNILTEKSLFCRLNQHVIYAGFLAECLAPELANVE